MRLFPTTPAARAAVAAALAALACTAACGKKAPPFIPVRARQAFFEYARVSPARGGALVSWKEAVTLPEPPSGEKWATYSLERGAGSEPFREVKSFKVSGEGGGARYEYLDLSLEAGREYRYRLKLFTGGRAAGYTHPDIAVTAGAGPPPPGRPEAEAGDGQVALVWAGPGAPPAGRTLVGYNLFRGEGEGAPDLGRPLTPQPVAAANYLDRPVANGRRYCYAVTAVLTGEAGVEESGPSAAACAVAQDRTPPAPPAGVRLSPGAGYVMVAWVESGDPDVAGYRVYRREAAGAFVLLTPAPVRASLFKDGSVEPGMTYAYAVSAVDGARPPNESPWSAPVEIVLPR